MATAANLDMSRLASISTGDSNTTPAPFPRTLSTNAIPPDLSTTLQSITTAWNGHAPSAASALRASWRASAIAPHAEHVWPHPSR